MLAIRPLTNESHDDRANVLRIFLESPWYIQLVEGRSPSAEDVEDFSTANRTARMLRINRSSASMLGRRWSGVQM